MTGKASSRKLYVRSSGARSAVAKQAPLESRQLLLSPRDPFDQVVDLLVGDRRPLDELIQLGVDPSAFLRAQLHRADDRCGVVCQERWLSWLLRAARDRVLCARLRAGDVV